LNKYDFGPRPNCFDYWLALLVALVPPVPVFQAGAKLILAARRQERLDQLADELGKHTVHLLRIVRSLLWRSALSTLPGHIEHSD